MTGRPVSLGGRAFQGRVSLGRYGRVGRVVRGRRPKSLPCLADRGGPPPGRVDAQADLSGASGDAGRDVQDAVAEGGDLAGGQIGVAVEADQFGPGHQICCGQDDFQPGGVRRTGGTAVGQPGGLGLADAGRPFSKSAQCRFESDWGHFPKRLGKLIGLTTLSDVRSIAASPPVCARRTAGASARNSGKPSLP